MSDGEFAVTQRADPSLDMGICHSGVTVAVAGPLATLTVSSPSPDLADGLHAARAELPGTVRVALLRISGLAVDEEDRPAAYLDTNDDTALARWQHAFDWYSAPALVSVAAVTGTVAGERLRLALGADLRVLSDDVRLEFRPPGYAPPVDHARLVSLAGSALATELCVAGVSLDAAGARAAGLANYVVDADELDEFATSLCARLADTDRDAATEMKALLLHAVSSPSGQHAAAERDALRRLRKARLGVERED